MRNTSTMTKVLAGLALLASIGPILFVAPLGFDPEYDLSIHTAIWVGHSAILAMVLFGLTFIAAGIDVAKGGARG